MNPEIREPDWITVQTGASLAFGLLGRLVYSFPEKEWLQSLVEQDPFDEAPFAAEQPEVTRGLELLQAWTASHRGRLTGEAIDDIRLDYTRLFIGPGRVLAPPWESVHRSVDRLLFQEQTLQVREWYQRFGLEAANLYQEPDDHAGLELAFLSQLAAMASGAAEQDPSAFPRLLEAERAFLAEHPIAWMPMWCELVIRHSETDFYRGVALVTRGTLAELAGLLGVAVPRWQLEEIE
jgi:TorA maturation chaperone TorD